MHGQQNVKKKKVHMRVYLVISMYRYLSGSVNKGCDSSVYDFRNDVDTEIHSHNFIRWLINAPAKGDMIAQFWGD